MAELGRARVWAMRTLFVGLSLVVVFFALLPLETTPSNWAAPDILTALVLAWSVRRPEYVPALLVASVMLLADLMFQRPPGLWAVLVLLASETLKPRERAQLVENFTIEWMRFAGFVIGMTLAYRLILVILLVEPGPLVLTMTQTLGTILAYPVVVLISWGLFGIRRPAPGDVDAMGYRA